MSLDDLAKRLERQLEEHRWLLVGGVLLAYFSVTAVLAVRRPMWHDEFCTFYVSLMPRVSGIWGALSKGMDQQPPLFFLITRGCYWLLGPTEFSTRLPAIFGFGLLVLSIFWFVHYRTSLFYALVTMLFPFLTFAFPYAYEGRPYALMLGWSAFALLCWQRVIQIDRRRLALTGLALSLALAVSTHYYSVLTFIPIALGEVVRSAYRRSADWKVWVALGLGALPLPFFLPLIRGGIGAYPHPWNRPALRFILDCYDVMLKPAATALFAVLISIAVLQVCSKSADGSGKRAPEIRWDEITAALAFAALPIFGFAVAVNGVNMISPRYVIGATVGFSILVSFATWVVGQARATVGLLLVLIFFGLCTYSLTLKMRDSFDPPGQSFFSVRGGCQQLSGKSLYVYKDLPIAVQDPNLLLPLSFYCGHEVSSRLVYLGDTKRSLRYVGTDDNLLLLRAAFPVHIENYEDFAHRHERYLLFSSMSPYGWTLRFLSEKGADLRILERTGADGLILLVTQNNAAQR